MFRGGLGGVWGCVVLSFFFYRVVLWCCALELLVIKALGVSCFLCLVRSLVLNGLWSEIGLEGCWSLELVP